MICALVSCDSGAALATMPRQPITAQIREQTRLEPEDAMIVGGHREEPRHVAGVDRPQDRFRVELRHDLGDAAEKDRGEGVGEAPRRGT